MVCQERLLPVGNRTTRTICSVTDASPNVFFGTMPFQSTLGVERTMDQRTAPRTHGLVLHWAARYDLLAWLLTHGRERELRERIIQLAGLDDGHVVLDVGCGTGTLAIAATRHIGATGSVTGIDASPSMVARATRKAAKAEAPAVFHVAVAEHLPFPDGRFDVVLSTLMLHHLPRNTRQQCAREIRRVLKGSGRVLAVDFGRAKPRGLLAHFHRHGHVEVQDMVTLFVEAGLTPVRTGSVGMNNLNFVLAEASLPEVRDQGTTE
jgi:ubiquinone/menaquinone biosynthesis C-methylase UbiE